MHPHPVPRHNPSPPSFMDNERVYTQSAMGLVGTGRTPQAARADLMEKIRHSGEL